MGKSERQARRAARKAARKAKKTPAPSVQYSAPIGPTSSGESLSSSSTTPSSSGSSSGGSSYQGPVRPTTDESTFRSTGTSKPTISSTPTPTVQYSAPIGPTKEGQGPAQKTIQAAADTTSGDGTLKRSIRTAKYEGLGAGFRELGIGGRKTGEEKVLTGTGFGAIDFGSGQYSKLQEKAFSKAYPDQVKTKFDIEEEQTTAIGKAGKEVQVSAQEDFEEYSSGIIDARVRGYQQQVDTGAINVEDAQKALDKEVSGLSSTYLESEDYKRLEGSYIEKVGEIGTPLSVGGYTRSVAGDIGEAGKVALSFTPPGAILETMQSYQKDVQKAQARALVGVGIGERESYSGGGKISVETGIAAAGAGLIGLGSGLAGFRAIERGLVADELSSLAKAPIKFKTVTDPVTGDIVTKAIQKQGRLIRETDIIGKVKKGKISSQFGAGESRISGDLAWNIRGGLGDSKIIGIQEFKVGSISIPKGTRAGKVSQEIGELNGAKVYRALEGNTGISEGISISQITPIQSTSAIFKIPKGARAATREGKRIGKQLAKVQYGGEGIISIDPIKSYSTKEALGFDLGESVGSKGAIFELNVPKPSKTIGTKYKLPPERKTPLGKTFGEPKTELKFTRDLDYKPLKITEDKGVSSSRNVILKQEGSIINAPKPKVETKLLKELKVTTPMKMKELNFLKAGRTSNLVKSNLVLSDQVKFAPGLKEGVIIKPALRELQLIKPSTKITPRETQISFTEVYSPEIGGIAPKIPIPKIPFLPKLPNLQFGTAGGSGKFSAKRLYQYAPSFGVIAGLTEGTTTKGIELGGREVFTGFEQRKYRKKKPVRKKKK